MSRLLLLAFASMLLALRLQEGSVRDAGKSVAHQVPQNIKVRKLKVG